MNEMAAEEADSGEEDRMTLGQFAKVQAAEQDDIPLDEALRVAQLTAEAYHAGRAATIAEIASSAAAYQAYDAALTEAQDALH